jgi:Sulfocyanin (SoxE) domain
MSTPWSITLALCLAAGSPGAAAAQSDKANPALPAIDPSWLSVDATSRTATFELIAGLTGANGALNFNGFTDGRLTLTVPVGWTVVMYFRNHDGMLPHSAEVIEDVHPLPLQPVTPAFPKAFTLRLAEGIPSEGRDDLRFIADKGGSYLIFCGVPGHGASGMWIRLMVSTSVAQPSLAATPSGQH